MKKSLFGGVQSPLLQTIIAATMNIIGIKISAFFIGLFFYIVYGVPAAIFIIIGVIGVLIGAMLEIRKRYRKRDHDPSKPLVHRRWAFFDC